MPSVTVDGPSYEAEVGERLIDVINRSGKEIPQVCYHPQLGPIQTCDTCRYADVVLPAAPSLEKEGTFTNTERRIQRLYEVFEPLSGTMPDWKIIQEVANRLGADWKYWHPSEIMAEIASPTPLFAGVTYERLEGYKTLQWPVHPDGTDEPLLFTEKFNFPDGKARFYPVGWLEPDEQVDDEFDLLLNNGRLLEHFHEGK
jgi:formate dehydrogenase major subunit